MHSSPHDYLDQVLTSTKQRNHQTIDPTGLQRNYVVLSHLYKNFPNVNELIRWCFEYSQFRDSEAGRRGDPLPAHLAE